MKASDLLILLGTKIEESQELKDWSQTHFGKDHTVYIGIDQENPPEETDYPLIVIFYIERIRGESDKRITYSAEIGAGIFKEGVVFPDQTENPNLKSYAGLPLVEEFRELLEDVLLYSKIGLVDVTGETTTEVYYPFFRSNTLFSLEFIRTSRKPLGKK